MKSTLIAVLLAFSAMLAQADATIVIQRADLQALYGNRDWKGIYHSDDMSVRCEEGMFFSGNAFHHYISFIEYRRGTSLYQMEIEDILKKLYPEEKWVSVDDKNWSLPKAGYDAHWDGSGKLVVTSKERK